MVLFSSSSRKKENMMATARRSQQMVNEKRLFHGTSPDAVEAICKQNFDWRLHGKNATKYGEGSYFAVNASYSHAYAKRDAGSSQFMFLSLVLVGSYTTGHSSYRRPPSKVPSDPASDLYDSCVDNLPNPTIFVVFDTDQFYPQYIIQYSTGSQTACDSASVLPKPSRAPIQPKPLPRSHTGIQQQSAKSAFANANAIALSQPRKARIRPKPLSTQSYTGIQQQSAKSASANASALSRPSKAPIRPNPPTSQSHKGIQQHPLGNPSRSILRGYPQTRALPNTSTHLSSATNSSGSHSVPPSGHSTTASSSRPARSSTLGTVSNPSGSTAGSGYPQTRSIPNTSTHLSSATNSSESFSFPPSGHSSTASGSRPARSSILSTASSQSGSTAGSGYPRTESISSRGVPSSNLSGSGAQSVNQSSTLHTSFVSPSSTSSTSHPPTSIYGSSTASSTGVLPNKKKKGDCLIS